VMVTDFGIAKVRDSADLTSNGTMVGTVKYLSPEQVEGGAVDARCDLYSLGVVLYESLLGRPPFVADTPVATALARLHQTPARPRSVRADVPPALDEVLMRALQRNPAHRFADAASLRAALLAPRVLPLGPTTDPTPVVDPTGLAARPVPGAHSDPTTTTVRPSPTPSAVGATATATRSQAGAVERHQVRRSSWLLPLVLLIVVGGSIALAAALVARTQAGDELLARVDEVSLGAAPVAATGARPFDPLGDADENGAQAILAVDGDPATAWRTETYQSRTFGNLKDGVGLIVDLDREADLDAVTVRSPTPGWTARYYVGDGTARSLDDWGQPVAEQTMAAGTTSIDLGGARGRAMLVWIVDLGDGGGRVEVSDLVLVG
jgi:eukaryotic-like serine/threonine-protein kinase